MAHFTILRFEKLKTRGAVSASAEHMCRTRPTPNADPERASLNRLLVGSRDPLADVDARLAGAVARSTSVLAIEVLISASPGWFDDATKAERIAWMTRSQAWLQKEFGKENVVHLQLHCDEATPHLTGFIVPRDDTTGRLNAARWLDGSKKLAALQTSHTAAVADLGLERGIEGSEATHSTPRRLRGAAKADVEDPATAKRLAKRTVFAEQRLVEAQDTMVSMRAAANAARDMPLQDVAETLGLEREQRDPSAWVDAQREHKLTIHGGQWFDHKAAKGGGGAIDLTMHILKTGFREAVAWLGFEMGHADTVRSVAAHAVAGAPQEVTRAMREARPFTPPSRDDSALWRVRKYLRGRFLPSSLVERMVDEGRLYADDRANAVFLALDAERRPRGAEVRGTGTEPFHGHATGSSRALPWGFDTGPNPRRLVFTESAIDAMSYAHLTGATDARILSTGGAKPVVPAAVVPSIQAGRWEEVVVAYDNDKTGREMAEKLTAALEQEGAIVTRELPTSQDWNQDLVARHVPLETPALT